MGQDIFGSAFDRQIRSIFSRRKPSFPFFFFCSFLSEPSILTDADSRQILIKPGLPKLDFVKRDLRDRWD